MPFYHFIWTDENTEHLAHNGVTPQEFTDVLNGPAKPIRSKSTGRPGVIGYTRAGRRLVAIFDEIDAGTILPVTAYDDELR